MISVAERRSFFPSICINSSLCILIASVLCGCLGYKLGPSNGLRAGEKSVSVNYFLNTTPEPGISDELMTAIRREVQVDGTYLLDTHSRGNLVISGKILQLNREAISLNPNRVEASRDLRLTLICEVTVTRGNTGDLVVQKLISAKSAIRNTGDLNRADQQTVPQMAEIMARKIISLISDGEWEAE